MTPKDKQEAGVVCVDNVQPTEIAGPRGVYEPPTLTMHGSLQDITRGLAGKRTDGDLDRS
jgi:hypothetical protein